MRFRFLFVQVLILCDAVVLGSLVDSARPIERAEAVGARDGDSLVGRLSGRSFQNRRAQGWILLGCYTDSVQARGLPYGAGVPGGGAALTVEACQAACVNAGYSYAGVEYSQECYCGNALQNGCGPAPDGNAQCTMTCNGNPGETCGGPNRMNMYTYGVLGASSSSSATSVTKTTTSSTTTSTSSTPSSSVSRTTTATTSTITTSSSPASTVIGWSILGCYTDNVNARSLNVAMGVTGGAGAMTVEACEAACKAAGYTLAGLEYSGECYCDNTLRNAASTAPDGYAQCTMTCNGNPKETCGGPNRLNLYTYATVAASSVMTTTSKPASTTSSSSTTPPSTTSKPASTTSTSSTTSSSTTSKPTSTTSTSSTAVPSTTSTTSTTSSTLTTSTTVPTTTSSAVAGWSAQGCYADAVNARILSVQPAVNGAMTIELCQAACANAGYPLAGVEYATECYCDSVLRNGGAPASDGSAQCNMACKGNAAEKCGGPNRINLFKFVAGSSTTSKTSTSTSTSTSAVVAPSNRAVFAHYLVGTMTSAEALADVQQGQAMGLDAFALNVQTATAQWCLNSLQYLFSAASSTGFKLFLSFDMTAFSDPSQFMSLIQMYYNNPAYYMRNGLPFVSTFDGGTDTFGYASPNAGWQAKYRTALSNVGISTYFVPVFDDSGVSPNNFFSTFPVVDGIFAWENSWPYISQGKVNVDSGTDQAYISAARSAGKTYMMGISALQFKHVDSNNNFYRRGGPGLAVRMQQILTAVPDFVQVQTWNDAGESHYIGPIYSEAIAGTNINAYTNGYDHTGWQVILKPFLAAFKAGVTTTANIYPSGGATAQGVFWHSTLLNSASCNGDSLGKPSGIANEEDVIEVAVLVASGTTGIKVNVFSGGTNIGSYSASPGLNYWEMKGMVTGQQKVQIVNAAGTVLSSATGTINVMADSSNCNYNPQVVALT